MTSMKFYSIIVSLLILVSLSSFSSYNSKALPDEYKYVKEVNGVRIYYAVKAYSPKPGKTAKKVVLKLKNSNARPKTVSLKITVQGEGGVITKEITQCLKGNEEHLKHEILTEHKEVKNVKLENEKATDGGC